MTSWVVSDSRTGGTGPGSEWEDEGGAGSMSMLSLLKCDTRMVVVVSSDRTSVYVYVCFQKEKA